MLKYLKKLFTFKVDKDNIYTINNSLLSNLNPRLFSDIHSSDFNNIYINTWCPCIEEYNSTLNKILYNRDKFYIRGLDLGKRYNVTVSKFFTSVDNCYIEEEASLTEFINNIYNISSLLEEKEKEKGYISNSNYNILKNVYKDSINICRILLNIQNTIL